MESEFPTSGTFLLRNSLGSAFFLLLWHRLLFIGKINILFTNVDIGLKSFYNLIRICDAFLLTRYGELLFPFRTPEALLEKKPAFLFFTA